MSIKKHAAKLRDEANACLRLAAALDGLQCDREIDYAFVTPDGASLVFAETDIAGAREVLRLLPPATNQWLVDAEDGTYYTARGPATVFKSRPIESVVVELDDDACVVWTTDLGGISARVSVRLTACDPADVLPALLGRPCAVQADAGPGRIRLLSTGLELAIAA